MAAGKAQVIVVGLGAHGSASLYQLAKRGASVIGLDQFSPPHTKGSTHGDTRITRLAIGEGAEYVPLVRRSHELWRELERETGQRLLFQTGGLIIAEANNPFLVQTRASARAYGIEHDNLDADGVRQNFPAFKVREGEEAYYEPAAGYVIPELAVETQLKLALKHGAQLRLNEKVISWKARRDGVEVSTNKGTYQAGRLIISAGSWLPELFPEGEGLFGIYQQMLYWFEIRDNYETLREMPVFIWEFEGKKQGFVHSLGFYGFPAINGPGGGLKVATELFDSSVDPNARPEPEAGRALEMYETYIRPHLADLGPQLVKSAACLYTSTEGSRFVIDKHPKYDSVLIVSPCSGHGFKHSAAIGESVAQWALEGKSYIDLSVFGLRELKA